MGGLKSQLEHEAPKKSWIEPPHPHQQGGSKSCDRGGVLTDNSQKVGGSLTIASPHLQKWGGSTPKKWGGIYHCEPPTLKSGGAEPPRAPPSVTPLVHDYIKQIKPVFYDTNHARNYQRKSITATVSTRLYFLLAGYRKRNY